MEIANTQFHFFLPLSLSLSLSQLQIPNFTSFSLSTLSLSLSLSLSHLLHSKLPTMEIANTQFQKMRKHGGGDGVFVT
jgi:hypothetical protein